MSVDLNKLSLLIRSQEFTAKGDVLAGTAAGAASPVAVGANATVFTADSTQTGGVKWVAAAALSNISVDVAANSTGGSIGADGPDCQVQMQALVDAAPAGSKFEVRPGIWDLLKPLQAPNPSSWSGAGMVKRGASSGQQPSMSTLRILTTAVDSDWHARGVITDKAFLTSVGGSPVLGVQIRDLHIAGNGTTGRRRGNGIILSSSPAMVERVSINGMYGNTTWTTGTAGDGYGIILSSYKFDATQLSGNPTQARVFAIVVESKMSVLLISDNTANGTWSDGVIEDIYMQNNLDLTSLQSVARIQIDHSSGWTISKIQQNGASGGHCIWLRNPDHTRLYDFHIDGWGGDETTATRVSAIRLSDFGVGAANQMGYTMISDGIIRWREDMTAPLPTYVGIEIVGTGNTQGPWKVDVSRVKGVMRVDNGAANPGFPFPQNAFGFSIKKPATSGSTDLTTYLNMDKVEFWDNSVPPIQMNDSQIFETARNSPADYRNTLPAIKVEGSGTNNWQRRAAIPTTTGVNQVQTITNGGAASGTFKLMFAGCVTTALQWNDTTANIQAALRALANTGGTTVTCGGAGPLSATTITCTFSGALAKLQLPLITVVTTTGGCVANPPTVAITTAGVSPSVYPVNMEFARDPQAVGATPKWIQTGVNDVSASMVYTALPVL